METPIVQEPRIDPPPADPTAGDEPAGILWDRLLAIGLCVLTSALGWLVIWGLYSTIAGVCARLWCGSGVGGGP